MDVRTMLQSQPSPPPSTTPASSTSTRQHSQYQSTASQQQQQNHQQQQQQDYSCVLCKQRKVRCDKQNPCSSCVRNGVACVPGSRRPYKRRKRNYSHGNSDHLNELLPPDISPPSRDLQVYSAPLSRPLDPRPIQDDVRPRRQGPGFTQSLWTGLNDEFQDPRARKSSSEEASTDDNSCSDLLLSGTPRDVVNLRIVHPSPMHSFMLWQIFLQKINPLSKVIHAPLVQNQVIEASRDFNSISKPSVALLFAIYSAALLGMKDEECQTQLNESKKTLMNRYFSATQQALASASFMKSRNIIVLQAFVIHLLTARHKLDAQSFWLLSGTAVRMALRLEGVNDAASSNSESIYETQIKRRLLWQIFWIDGRSHQGVGLKPASYEADAFPLPANLNDADINPDMTEMPLLHKGPTEMTFCRCRYEVGLFMAAGAKKLQDPYTSIQEKDRIIDQFEAQMKENYLKYLDSAIPLHMMAEGGVISAICKFKLMAHHPSQFPDKGKSMPKAERDMCFAASVQMVENDTIGKSAKILDIFSWHLDALFQIDAFVFMLIASRTQAADAPLTQKAWNLVVEMFKLRPALLDDDRNELYVAVRELVVRAWDAREADVARRKLQPLPVPDVISNLRDRKVKKTRIRTTSNPVVPPEASALHQLAGVATQVDARYEDEPGLIDVSTCSFQPEQFDGMFDNFNTDIDLSGWSPVDWDFWNNIIERNVVQ